MLSSVGIFKKDDMPGVVVGETELPGRPSVSGSEFPQPEAQIYDVAQRSPVLVSSSPSESEAQIDDIQQTSLMLVSASPAAIFTA